MDKVGWVRVDTGLVWVFSSFEYLMDNVSSLQLNTGHTLVVSSLEIFDG
jgi:hypothetical protein